MRLSIVVTTPEKKIEEKSMKRLYLVKIVGLIGIIFCATKIFAMPLTLEEVGVVPAQVISAHLSNFYNGGVLAGMYEVKINGVLTESYCVEFLQFSPSGPTGYDFIGLPSDSKYKEAAWIMQNYDPARINYNQVVNAQVAIWEILSADPGNLWSGDLSVQSWSGYGSREGAQAIVDQVLNLYNNNPNYFNNFDTTSFKLAHNDNFQDYLVKSQDHVNPQDHPVPEPSTILLLCGGLIGLLGIREKFKFNR